MDLCRTTKGLTYLVISVVNIVVDDLGILKTGSRLVFVDKMVELGGP